MSAAENIEKLIKKFCIAKKSSVTTSPGMDKRVLDDALAAYGKSKMSESADSQPFVWRIIMKSKITKLATAAAVIIAVVLTVTVLDKATPTAWAIEDTIKALEHIYSIKMSGTTTNDDGTTEGEFVLWARPNEDGTESGELRFEVPDQQIIIVTQSGATYRYHPGPNVVYVKEYKDFRINPWLGSEFFQRVKRFVENWKISYGKDEETGRDSIFATCVHPLEAKSWWFQFDSQTKLPIRFKQWTNVNFAGTPQFYAAEIQYNSKLPAQIFEFEIPDGAKVVKVPKKLAGYFDDPNVGISSEGLTDEEACLVLIEDYWRAIIDGDWEYLAQLRPICNAENWELKYKRNENWPVEVLEIGQPSQKEDCNIGPLVPCMVRYSDGQIKNIQMVVKLRDIEGNKSCVIAGTYGGTKDFER